MGFRLFREEIRGKRIIANPGCWVNNGNARTALAPALREGLILPERHHRGLQVRRDRGGRGLAQNLHYAECNEVLYGI